MNKRLSLYIVGSITLPKGDAGALRIMELCEGFKPYFNKIIIAGKYNNVPHKYYSFDKKISFLPYHKPTSNGVFDKLTLIFKPYKFIMNDLKECVKSQHITHILIYSAIEVRTARKIKKFAKAEGIKIIFDVVEFQTFSKQTLTSFASFYIPNIYLNKRLISSDCNVIAISSYLTDYFRSKNINAVKIPFVFDTKRVNCVLEKQENKKLQLIYAGSPKKGKDLLINSIKGLLLLEEDKKEKLIFLVAGLTREDFYKNNKSIRTFSNTIDKYVTFLGKIANAEIEKLYEKSDFSVLIRDEKDRLSMAGFPTKVSESLAHAVPVICNISSDLNQYLINGSNSLIMNNNSPEEFARCVSNAIALDRNRLNELRQNARRTSEKQLDVFLFDREIKTII